MSGRGLLGAVATAVAKKFIRHQDKSRGIVATASIGIARQAGVKPNASRDGRAACQTQAALSTITLGFVADVRRIHRGIRLARIQRLFFEYVVRRRIFAA